MSELDPERIAEIEAEERARAEIKKKLEAEGKAKQGQQTQGWLFGCFGLIFIAFLIGIFSSKSSSSEPDEKTLYGVEKAALYYACKKLIPAKLKAPSTAKFPDYEDSMFGMGTSVSQWTAYVDSQNGFGAMIRTNFVCTYVRAKDGLKVEFQ